MSHRTCPLLVVCLGRLFCQQFIRWVSVGTRLAGGNEMGDHFPDVSGEQRELGLRLEQVLQHGSKSHSFLWLDNKQLKCVNPILFNHSSVGRCWVVSTSWLL